MPPPSARRRRGRAGLRAHERAQTQAPVDEAGQEPLAEAPVLLEKGERHARVEVEQQGEDDGELRLELGDPAVLRLQRVEHAVDEAGDVGAMALEDAAERGAIPLARPSHERRGVINGIARPVLR